VGHNLGDNHSYWHLIYIVYFFNSAWLAHVLAIWANASYRLPTF